MYVILLLKDWKKQNFVIAVKSVEHVSLRIKAKPSQYHNLIPHKNINKTNLEQTGHFQDISFETISSPPPFFTYTRHALARACYDLAHVSNICSRSLAAEAHE